MTKHINSIGNNNKKTEIPALSEVYSFCKSGLLPSFESFLGWFESAYPYRLSPNSFWTLLIFVNLNSARQSTTEDISWCEKTKYITLSDDRWFMSTKYHSCFNHELSKTMKFMFYWTFFSYGEDSLFNTCYQCMHKNNIVIMYFWVNWITKVCCKIWECKVSLKKIAQA